MVRPYCIGYGGYGCSVHCSEYHCEHQRVFIISTFPENHRKQTSNFSFIDNLKKLATASKQDGLVLSTLRYTRWLFWYEDKELFGLTKIVP